MEKVGQNSSTIASTLIELFFSYNLFIPFLLNKQCKSYCFCLHLRLESNVFRTWIIFIVEPYNWKMVQYSSTRFRPIICTCNQCWLSCSSYQLYSLFKQANIKDKTSKTHQWENPYFRNMLARALGYGLGLIAAQLLPWISGCGERSVLLSHVRHEAIQLSLWHHGSMREGLTTHLSPAAVTWCLQETADCCQSLYVLALHVSAASHLSLKIFLTVWSLTSRLLHGMKQNFVQFLVFIIS